MSFKDQPWSARFAQMGDQAEGIFERVYPLGFARFGLRRPPIQVGKLPLKLRYAPDYITTSSLIEVQGFADDTVKVKTEKHLALQLWDQDMPVQLFLYDSRNERHGLTPIAQLTHDIFTHGTIARFPEGKPYWAIPAETMEMQWVPSAP